MNISLIVSEYDVNPLKFASAGAILAGMRKASIECSRIILVSPTAKPEQPLWNSIIKQYVLKVLRALIRSSILKPLEKKVTSNKVFRCYSNLISDKTVIENTNILNDFIRNNPLRVLSTDNLLDQNFLNELKYASLDIAVLRGGGILKKRFLDCFRTGVINCHGAGYLPYYRGLGAVEFAMIHEDPLCINIHLVDRGIDTGVILKQMKLELSGHETLAEIYAIINAIGTNVIVDTVEGILKGEITPIPQESDAGRQHFLPHPLMEDIALDKHFSRHNCGQQG